MRRLSLRARLLALAVASMVPLLGFSLLVQYLQYRDAITSTGERNRMLARSVVYAVEQELQKYIAVLEALALSPALQEGDIATFRKRLELVSVWQFPDANFLLLDLDGQHLINTGLPAGQPMPIRLNLEVTQRAVDSGGAAVSDLFTGRVVQRPVIAIDVPVRRADGRIAWVLSLNPPFDAFGKVIRRQDLPPSWAIAVLDRQGVVVAREPNSDQFIGKLASSSLRAHLLVQREGVLETHTIDGVPVLSAFARSDIFNWAVAIGVPHAELAAPATRTALRTLALGGILLLVTIALALAVARQISRPIATLRRVAEGGSAALAAAPARTGLPEADVVVEALRTAEARRQRSEQSFRYLFESGPVPMWVYDPETLEFLAVNDAAVETYGYSRAEFLAMTVAEIRPPEDLERMRRIVADPPVRQYARDGRHRLKDGTVVDIETFSHAISFEGRPSRMLIVLDVTARKAAEAQLVQAQKMEAVGQLTGGLAHDFNNLLGVVIGNAGLLEDGGADDPDFPLFVEEIKTAAQRGAALTRSLLAFSRNQPLRPTRADPNALVSEITTLLRRTLGERIEVTLDLASDVWPVVVDPIQLESSLANLATNARDAMPKGGRLAIVSANRRLDADYAAEHAEVQAGDYVMIQVSDSGVGMAPEVLSRVFEPFFTTKVRGQGTGLGLAMVFGFIKQSGGHINVYSEVGVGTTFRLYLPRAPESVTEAVETDEAQAPRGHGERVLVVEDNPALRRMAVRQLEQLGYRVDAVENATAALALLGADAPFDLVFSDVVMAGKMDGFDLVRTITTRWPHVRIVMTSGFPGTDANGHVEPAPEVRLLSKPYRKEDLARALRAALDADMSATQRV